MDQLIETGAITTADGRRLHVSTDPSSSWPFTIRCSRDASGQSFAVSLTTFEFERLQTLMDRMNRTRAVERPTLIGREDEWAIYGSPHFRGIAASDLVPPAIATSAVGSSVRTSP
jgi:hypothetical protein